MSNWAVRCDSKFMHRDKKSKATLFFLPHTGSNTKIRTKIPIKCKNDGGRGDVGGGGSDGYTSTRKKCSKYFCDMKKVLPH